jgi:hypothetical protein
MKKMIRVAIVRGQEGFALILTDEDGNGVRCAGPKAWGNPRNVPTAEFILDADDFVDHIQRFAYEKEEEGGNKGYEML